MSNRTLTPQMPGEPVAQLEPAADEQTQAVEVEQIAAEESQTAAEPVPAVAQTKQRAARGSKATVSGSLPKQSAVDATKIDRAVLTEDGWVVPHKLEKPKAG